MGYPFIVSCHFQSEPYLHCPRSELKFSYVECAGGANKVPIPKRSSLQYPFHYPHLEWVDLRNAYYTLFAELSERRRNKENQVINTSLENRLLRWGA